MFTHEKLQFLLEQYSESVSFYLAYSGGLDSQVLLHALHRLLPAVRLRAIHVNHGWHADAIKWASFCQKTCEELGVDCEVIHVDARPKSGESLEAYARQLRYAAIAKRIPARDYLLTAHHLDDQAETLLLQLLRGTGLKGLVSMPFCQPFAQAHMMRPLLEFTRAELQVYAKEQKIVWVEDISNTTLRFNRNFIRHQILPLVQQRWPQANKTLARAAENVKEAHHLLEELADEDWCTVREPTSNGLIISCLLRLSPARRRNVLRYWLKQLNFSMPSQKQLQQVEYLLASKIDAFPQVSWGKVQVRRYRGFLYALGLEKSKPQLTTTFLWTLNQNLMIPALGRLTAEQVLGQGLASSSLKNKEVEVSFRQGGERFYSYGRSGSHPLKKLFQEWGVPPWQREQVPLIYYQKELVAVVDYGIHPRFVAKPGEFGFVLKLTPVHLLNHDKARTRT